MKGGRVATAVDPDEREEMLGRLVTAFRESVFVEVAYLQTAKRLLELRDSGKDPDGDPMLEWWPRALMSAIRGYYDQRVSLQ